MDPNQPQQLDQDAVRLAKAIRFSESRDKEDAKGASGEFGLYQFMPDTWTATAKKYNLNPGDVSRENQNKAAYMQIKELKDAGHTPDQIAAYWNMGEKGLTDYSKNVGTNKYGVKYDTPAYVNVVKDTYNRLKQNEATPLEQIGKTPSTPGNEQFGTPDPTPANGELLQDPALKPKLNPVAEVAKGFGKGLAGGLVDMSRLGSTVANQTAGRVVSAIEGKGFKPLDLTQSGDTLENPESPSSKATDSALKSRNAYQTGGKVAEFGAEMLVPGLGAKKVMEARRLAGAFGEALDIVAPKETAAVIKNAYKGGRAQVSGFLRNVTMTPDQATERAAQAVEDLVKAKKISSKMTAAQKSNVVYEEIGTQADSLVKQLKSMEITPTLQPGELEALFKNATAKIGEDPTMVGNAGESASRIFTKFKSFLPQGKDITAADLLEARKKLDAWVRASKGDKVFDPATENAMTTSLRAIRQEANDLVATKAPDVAVKEMLAKQSALYDALENIASKGVKEMGTNAPKRFMQRHPLIKLATQGLIPGGAIGGLIGAKVFGDH